MCTPSMDLGSGVVSCGILTTKTLVQVPLAICHATPHLMTTNVAQPLVEGPDFNKLQASSSKLDSD